jgi:hypothetical protein
MVKSRSEYKFDIFTNYVRTKTKTPLDVDKMLSYLEIHCNRVNVQNNKNNDGLVIFVLKPNQYKNSNVGLGITIEEGKIVNNVRSVVTQTYNNIIKNCGSIPAKHNTKYLVIEQDFYDKYEGKSSLRTLHVMVSHVINNNGKSRVLVGFYPEIRESAVDIVNKAIEQENALVLDHPHYQTVNNAKIGDCLHTVINISAFSQSLLNLYPKLDAQSLHEQLKQVIIGFEVKEVKKYKNNTFTHCATYDSGNYKQIKRIQEPSRGRATINNDIIHILEHSYFIRVKSKDDNAPDYIVNMIITGSTSLDYSCDLHKGKFTCQVRVCSTENEIINNNNRNINSKDLFGFFSDFFSPPSSSSPPGPPYIPPTQDIPTQAPITIGQFGQCLAAGIAVGLGTDKADNICDNITTSDYGAWGDVACLIGGALGDVANSE